MILVVDRNNAGAIFLIEAMKRNYNYNVYSIWYSLKCRCEHKTMQTRYNNSLSYMVSIKSGWSYDNIIVVIVNS